MPREVELKLDLNATSLRQIAHWLLHRKNKKGVTQLYRTIYFDTRDFVLRRSGISLRVRKIGDAYLQTIKLANRSAAGIFDRSEWETSVKGFRPDFAAARSTGLKPFRSKHLSKLVRTAFEIQLRRATYAVSDGGAQLELALDRGKILARKHSAPFCELEIELKQGKAAALFRVVQTLGRIVPLRLGVQTKADRGYGLVHGNEPGVSRAEKAALQPKMTAEDAFRLIARDCLRQLVANVPATLEGNGEALHQMRVALRRMRASMSAFSDMIADSDVGKCKSELRWITGQLGMARDLDVLLDETLKPQPDGDAKEGLQAIVRTFRAQRQRAYGQVREALFSQRFRNLVLETLTWIECGRWRRKRGALAIAQREQAIVTHAAGELRRRYKKFAKEFADFKTLDPAQRHRLRIRAKRLRYAVEFFGGVFPGKKNAQRHEGILSALKELQDTLGALNDIATHEKLMSEFASSRKVDPSLGAAETFTAGIIYSLEEARIEQLLDAANAATRKISDVKPFWE